MCCSAKSPRGTNGVARPEMAFTKVTFPAIVTPTGIEAVACRHPTSSTTCTICCVPRGVTT